MDATSIIMGIVLLAICIIPVLIMNKYGKGNKHDDAK
jgi:hypothetical protein